MKTTMRIHATEVRFHYAQDEGSPADTDGQFFGSLASLKRAGNAPPLDGRWAEVRLSDGSVYELDADGSSWAVDGSTSREYDTLVDAVDHLEVVANER